MTDMIPLYKPYMPELPLLEEVLHSGAIAYGVHSKKFEHLLGEYFGTKQVLVTNTFHTAVSVALTAICAVPGDEVIASPMACLASTQPYHAAGMRIVWADVDPERGTLAPDSVRQKITPRTKCIVHNHFCGYPGHIEELHRIGRKYGIPVIDDGIECFGSIYKGALIGSGSDIAVFSFNPVRLPNTIDGGAVVFRDMAMYEKAILIRDCGIDRNRFRDEHGEIDPRCDITLTGFSATMSNVNGYVGCEQMKYVAKLLEKQRQNAAAWDKVLERLPQYTPLHIPGDTPNYWVYGLLAGNKKAAIQTFRKAGFQASGVHINNNLYSVFGPPESLPGVETFYDHFVALPSGWWVEASSIALSSAE